MSRLDRRQALGLALFGTAGPTFGSRPSLAQAASNQAFPNQMVRMIVPFSAGSMTDILARSLAEKLREKWGQQVIVENRPGIAGTGGVARSTPDGLTLMLTSNGHTVIRSVNKDVTFDPVKDFVGITKVASMPSIMVAPAEGDIRTLKDLIDAARARPGQLNYGSAGLGSSTGIAAEVFRQVTGTRMQLVPYRGMPESQTSVLRGDSAFCFTFFNVGGDLIQAGRLRALAVTGETRMAQLPDVPTFRQAGLADFTYDAWFGVMGPAGMPKPLVAQIARDIAAGLAEADIKTRFEQQGVNLVTTTPEAFDAEIARDAERYGPLVRQAAGG
ncbi:tripartite tricarboxylate transporter substrate binding protein [Phreatobacter stygius]|uniref:Tripartite tricarboxylate transporter substrate binding protein n=2 Tax=Phreatobacter stygius TaxID=1940610 RepID=A0A4D7B913_9HYPH|nr:tripartite tricarboxylate transporter substrate binding protein [Phreatobacter stygius]